MKKYKTLFLTNSKSTGVMLYTTKENSQRHNKKITDQSHKWFWQNTSWCADIYGKSIDIYPIKTCETCS